MLKMINNPPDIPLLGMLAFRAVNGDRAVYNGSYHIHYGISDIFSLKHLFSLRIDYPALYVHYIVVLQNVLSYVEVSALNPFLSLFDLF